MPPGARPGSRLCISFQPLSAADLAPTIRHVRTNLEANGWRVLATPAADLRSGRAGSVIAGLA